MASEYEAVEHYPNRIVHIYNKLIHNPEVNNDQGTEMCQSRGKGGVRQERLFHCSDLDVLILPAFDALYEEMKMSDKEVRDMAFGCYKFWIWCWTCCTQIFHHPFGIRLHKKDTTCACA